MSAPAIACNRFGLGAAPGELTDATADPRGWLKQQLERYDPRPAPLRELPGTAEALSLAPLYRRRLDRAEVEPPPSRWMEDADSPAQAGRRLLQAERLAWLEQAVSSRQSFCERLVHFWANRLTAAMNQGGLRPLIGLYERETIRPHVMGRFEDLLLASARAPAMLIYLDNHRSIGPGSRLGERRGRGLNENYAREVMELHSLGVDGGYDQADVVELAKGLTGWTLPAPEDLAGSDGFAFDARAHEPGARRLLGQRHDQEGEEQGRAMLKDLARHPSTARHLSRSLLQYFVTDTPPPAAVERLAGRFLETGGDLPALYDALLDSPEAWAEGRQKFKRPEEYLVSLLRALPETPQIRPALLRSLTEMGQPLWEAPSPAGWPEEAADWVSANAVWERLQIAERESRRQAADVDPRRLLESCLGGAAGEATLFHVAAAESREQGLTLLFMSPDFQWR